MQEAENYCYVVTKFKKYFFWQNFDFDKAPGDGVINWKTHRL